jgi:hypothetical protein
MLTAQQAPWLDHHGKVVKLHGHMHFLKVETYKAIDPYAHTVLRVHAIPLSTTQRTFSAAPRCTTHRRAADPCAAHMTSLTHLPHKE